MSHPDFEGGTSTKKEDPMANPNQKLIETVESLRRIQGFNIKTLPRKDDLGSNLSFEEALEPASRLIELYKRLPTTVLEDFPENVLDPIRNKANEDYTRFNEMLKFDPSGANPKNARKTLIDGLIASYQPAFTTLHPFIAYSLYKSADFTRLESEARSTFQSINDQSKKLMDSLETSQKEANNVLQEIRKVAEEQGVTQQAIYFKNESDAHDKRARKWFWGTIGVTGLLCGYAVFSLFFHKIPAIAPATDYDRIQIAVSKVLIFAVISYMLYLCGRNFISHKHNSIVNRHRQNALMTYRALVEAAGDTPNREVVLVQAASCIFSPQCTGYAKDEGSQFPGSKSIVEYMMKPFSKTS
jgi:hypothetical protein